MIASCSSSNKHINSLTRQDFEVSEGHKTFIGHSNDPNASILYFTESCMLFGRFSTPYALVIAPDFNPRTVPITLLNSMYQVQILYVEDMDHGSRQKAMRFDVPEWINNFKNLQVLKFDGLELGELQNRNLLSVRHLIVGRIKYDKALRVNDLVDLNSLNYLVYINPRSIENISAISRHAPHVKILKQRNYNKMVDGGQIIMIQN